jgi:CheY-like chemotaxis protein
LELTKLERPDLILLDFRMLEMDGLQVYQCLQVDKNLRSIPVIFMTASKDTNLDEKLLSITVNDRIIKPFEAEELFDKVKKIIV